MTDWQKIKLFVENSNDNLHIQPVQQWLKDLGVEFSPFGSAIPFNVFLLDNKQTDYLLDSPETNIMGVVLEALVGMAAFTDTKTEKRFWKKLTKKFKKVYKFDISKDILPKNF